MDALTAYSLVAYINKKSTRFSAETQDFQEQTWVIVRDSKPAPSARYIEPILDLPAYLERADRPRPLEPDLRLLLEAWGDAEIK